MSYRVHQSDSTFVVEDRSRVSLVLGLVGLAIATLAALGVWWNPPASTISFASVLAAVLVMGALGLLFVLSPFGQRVGFAAPDRVDIIERYVLGRRIYSEAHAGIDTLSVYRLTNVNGPDKFFPALTRTDGTELLLGFGRSDESAMRAFVEHLRAQVRP